MATVTGMTAEAMQAIANNVIIGAEVNSSGNLILTKQDDTTVNAGDVRGPAGVDVVSAEVDTVGDLILTKSDTTTVNAGRVKGVDGIDVLSTPEYVTNSYGRYDPQTNLYVPRSISLSGFKNRIHAAFAGRATTINIVGSSSVAGFGATNKKDGFAWQQQSLFENAGYPINGSGLQIVGCAVLASAPGWTFSGTINTYSTAVAHLDSGTYVEYTTEQTGDRVRVFYLNNGGAFTVTIDGGSPQTVTPSGANSMGNVVYTVANTTHVIRVTATTSTPAQISGLETYQLWGTGVNFTIAGIGGTTTSAWTSHLYTGNMWQTINRAPALSVLAINGNDFTMSVPRETTKSRLLTSISFFKYFNGEVLLVLMPVTSAANKADYEAHASVLYEVADEALVPLLDMNDRWGTYTLINGAGLSADGTHPSTRGHTLYAKALFDVIGRI